MMISMAKYVKIGNDKDIVELNEEKYCYKCEYFFAPSGCANLFAVVTPFHSCKDWNKANEKDIEENKDKIEECCRIDKIRRINKYKERIRAYKREIDTDFRQILALLDMGDKNEEK
jgi:hypothetical protein